MTRIIEGYLPTERVRDWGSELIVAEGPGCVGKVLRYTAGKAGGLQAHGKRWEAFFLFSGEAWVDSDDGDGDLIRQKMTPGMTFVIPPGAAHRFTAITDCTVFEVSTSAAEDRIRLEAQYGEPEVGGLPTTEPRCSQVMAVEEVPDPVRDNVDLCYPIVVLRDDQLARIAEAVADELEARAKYERESLWGEQ